VEETESDASSDSEDVSAPLQQHPSSAQQRHLNANANQSGADRPVAGGGVANASVRSRRPDGQCTVTEV